MSTARSTAARNRLAASLTRLNEVLVDGIYRSGTLPRADYARLRKANYLAPICRGWFHVDNPRSPYDAHGWQIHYLAFLDQYLRSRGRYILGPDDSVFLQSVPTSLRSEVIAFVCGASYQRINLPHGHTLTLRPATKARARTRLSYNGLRVMRLEAALAKISVAFKAAHPITIGATESALIEAKGEFNPQDVSALILKHKLHRMWARMRTDVLAQRPVDNKPTGVDCCNSSKALYEIDAINSLWIEGYRPEPWQISAARDDDYYALAVKLRQTDRNLSAARGYWLAWQSVLSSIAKAPPPSVLLHSAEAWQRTMMTPVVAAGVAPSHHLGYRKTPAFIAGSRHMPIPPRFVIASISTLGSLVDAELNPMIRAMLGHAFFEFIHPFADGNGRIGRLLMNALLIVGGQNWVSIPYEKRYRYMQALEQTSTDCEATKLNDLLHLL